METALNHTVAEDAITLLLLGEISLCSVLMPDRMHHAT